jgi:hypothetical protein
MWGNHLIGARWRSPIETESTSAPIAPGKSRARIFGGSITSSLSIWIISPRSRPFGRLRPPSAAAKLSLLLDHVEGRQGDAVADPYYGDAAAFDVTWADVTSGAEALARKIAGPK